ncbi:MAG: 16S rRNA (cytosine(967)-C(5))-methyltransferase RsmB [Ruminococcaceae bacterium]|nr:16S rRNA (cytosine(967)-C(5))-methyltransferase RsmB [Oscillospiraceae bacterium]
MANKTARELAFETLLKIEKEDSYSNLAISGVLKDETLESADKAFFTHLVYGVIERLLTLDYNINLYLKNPKIKPNVRTILRLSAYQVLFMENIPDAAAINEGVNLTKKYKLDYATGLTNAVLRKISQNGLIIPEDNDEIKYSCPKELIDMWTKDYGEENTKGILSHINKVPKTYIRINTTKVDLNNPTNTPTQVLTTIPDPNTDKYHVQDKSSQLCCEALDPQPGERILDVCAAPGGKSFTIAQLMDNKGEVVARDIHEHRVKLIKDGAARLGLSIINAGVGDAEVFDESLGIFDRVIADVPCAGFGIIGRKPEIRYKSISNIDYLNRLQYNILTVSSRYLASKGTLVYSTCSLNKRENEEVVKKFLEKCKDFELITQKTIFPHTLDCDGFFYAVFKRH